MTDQAAAIPAQLSTMFARGFNPAVITPTNAIKPGQWIATPGLHGHLLLVAQDLLAEATTLWPSAAVEPSEVAQAVIRNNEDGYI